MTQNASQLYQQPSVVVVDDEPTIRSILSSSYADQGYQVYEASCEGEAIALCKKVTPDLLVTDVRMPNGDGRTLVEKVRSNEDLDPIIFCISSFRDMSQPEIFSRGIDQFFQKPVCLETLLNASHHFLSHRRKRRSHGMRNYVAAKESVSTLLTYLKDYLVVTDENGVILEHSDSFRKLRKENSQRSLKGRMFSTTISPSEYADFCRTEWPQIVNGEIETTSVCLETPSGETQCVEFLWTEGVWFGSKAFFALGRAQSKQSELEENLQKNCNYKIATAQAKLEIIQNSATEIRLQLHAIAGYASMLESSAPGPREKRFVQSILKSTSTAHGNITDVIDATHP